MANSYNKLIEEDFQIICDVCLESETYLGKHFFFYFTYLLSEIVICEG